MSARSRSTADEAHGELEAELLDVAVEAARAAAAQLLARWRRPLEVETKSTSTDPVSEADLAAERAIRTVLGRRRPGDWILGEEGGQTGGGGRSDPRPDRAPTGHNLRWIVDPLDGTVNYLYGLPSFAVSIAVEGADGALAAAVFDPVQDELFSATRTGPALCNRSPIRGSTCDSLDHALVGTGFGYDPDVRAAQAEVARRLIPLARDIRRAGAAALDMCWCACGRLDAYYERGVKLWDIAAGSLICERAGLAVQELQATDSLPAGVAVAPDALMPQLMGLVGAA